MPNNDRNTWAIKYTKLKTIGNTKPKRDNNINKTNGAANIIQIDLHMVYSFHKKNKMRGVSDDSNVDLYRYCFP